MFSRVLLFAPLVFICHFLEESPEFVSWFNAHVARGITSGLFWQVNVSALFITVTVVGIEWFARSALSLILAVAWLSFLMLANAVFHVAAGIVDGQYVPGLVTAILLYIPYYAWLFTGAIRSKRSRITAVFLALGVGSLPMLVHGYLIVFRGSRLF